MKLKQAFSVMLSEKMLAVFKNASFDKVNEFNKSASIVLNQNKNFPTLLEDAQSVIAKKAIDYINTLGAQSDPAKAFIEVSKTYVDGLKGLNLPERCY